MLICYRMRCCILVLLMLSGIAVGVVSPVQAVKDARAQLRQEADYTFESALDRVARAESVCIVAEGSPDDANLTKAEFDSLILDKTSSGDTTTAWERIGAIAARFDYTVKQRGRLYILLKRYSSPRDLPDLTLEECFVSFDNLQSTIGLFQPSKEQFGRSPYNHLVLNLYMSLTEEQRERYKAGTLRANTLSDEQQEWVVYAALQYYSLNRNQNTLLVAREDCLTAIRIDATLRREEPTVPTAVFWAAPKTLDLDLANLSFPKELSMPALRGAPAKEPRVEESRPAGVRARYRYSLSDALKHCSDSNSEGAVSVDTRIAAKRVTLVGAEFIKGMDLLGAVADIYGLRMARDSGKVLLTLPQAPQKPRIAEIVPTLRRLMPAPVVRALHLEDLDRIYKKLQGEDRVYEGRTYRPDLAAQRLTDEERAARFRYLTIATDYYETAIRQACQRIAEYPAKAKGEEVPVVALGEERNRLLANLILWKALAGNCEYLYALPGSVASFDNLYLIGGPMRMDGKPALGIGFITRSPTGPGKSTWGSAIYHVFETDPGFSLIESQLPPKKPRPPKP